MRNEASSSTKSQETEGDVDLLVTGEGEYYFDPILS